MRSSFSEDVRLNRQTVMAVDAWVFSRAPDGFSLSPREREGVRILRNEVSRIEPLNPSAPKGQHDNSPGQASTASAALGSNALNIFSLSSCGGRRGPGRGGLPCGRFMERKRPSGRVSRGADVSG